MVLKRQVPTQEEPQKDIEKEREKFIMGGGLVASDVKKQPNKNIWTKICLRIKEEALDKIDDSISKKMCGNRTSWILDAISEKLQREG